ncbi:MAG: aldo/keto reductase [Planctomycetota bacterium]|nr:MAG: aldo/keto reductase [Planctomycetota bacterium]
MIKRILPVIDQPISVIGLGCFAIGGYMWGEQDQRDSQEAITAALEAGINWVDTAPLYGDGHAERVLGGLLAEIRPADRPLVATKFGHVVDAQGQRVKRAGRGDVLADCEASLANLGVECIDLYQLHWPAPEPIAETAATCAELIAAGKVRAIGVSNVGVDELEVWRQSGVRLASVQNYYSLYRRQDEAEILPWCAEHDIAYLAYSPMHRGLLFGAWGPDKRFPAGDHRAERPDFTPPRLPILLAATQRLRALAECHELTMAELATGALLSREGCTALIVGARNAAQGAALGDLGLPLKSSLLAEVEAILAETDAALAVLPA